MPKQSKAGLSEWCSHVFGKIYPALVPALYQLRTC